MNNKRNLGTTTINNATTAPVNTQSIINGAVSPAPMGLGLEARTRSGLYPELLYSARSVYNQTDNITTTERSLGMPAGSSDNIYHRLTGTTGSGIQISSSSALDTAASTGALTIYVDGIKISNSGNTWTDISTFSTPTTLNGQTAVQIGTDTDWYRINKIWVLTSGTGDTNAGDLYISPLGQSLSSGVPTANTIRAVIAGYGNSSGGCFSVATGIRFEYTKGNFWIDPTKAIRIHEFFYQDFNGSGNTADMTKYEVGLYPSVSASYDYTGAAPYTEKSDICLNVFTTTGSASALTYYAEYILIDASKVNL